jgi:hypothetical protein
MGIRAKRELDTGKAPVKGFSFFDLKTCIHFLFFFGVFQSHYTRQISGGKIKWK